MALDWKYSELIIPDLVKEIFDNNSGNITVLEEFTHTINYLSSINAKNAFFKVIPIEKISFPWIAIYILDSSTTWA